MWVNQFVKETIEANTIENSAKILNKTEKQIHCVITRYNLTYKPSEKWRISEKAKKILSDIDKGDLSQSAIARKYQVSRQYVSKLKQKWVEKQKAQHILL